MALADEITAALRAGLDRQAPWVDPGQGANWVAGLGRALGIRPEDRTEYPRGRAYRIWCPAYAGDGEPFRYVLRVIISGAGPFATHLFVKLSAQGRWWSNATHTSRSGYYPEHAEAIARLRAWYAETGLCEVDVQTQALPAPDDVPVPRRGDVAPSLYQALFGS